MSVAVLALPISICRGLVAHWPAGWIAKSNLNYFWNSFFCYYVTKVGLPEKQIAREIFAGREIIVI